MSILKQCSKLAPCAERRISVILTKHNFLPSSAQPQGRLRYFEVAARGSLTRGRVSARAVRAHDATSVPAAQDAHKAAYRRFAELSRALFAVASGETSPGSGRESAVSRASAGARWARGDDRLPGFRKAVDLWRWEGDLNYAGRCVSAGGRAHKRERGRPVRSSRRTESGTAAGTLRVGGAHR